MSDSNAKKIISRALKPFYTEGFREMPWRSDTSAYSVFVSEIMLQQTQVPRVLQKFPPFVRRFSGFDALAAASLSDVYPLWQGLGYNRRAKWMRDAALMIRDRFGGVLPDRREDLESLPGIGPHTAAAMIVYAYNKPELFIETNVRTVFIHHFFSGIDDVSDKDIRALVERTIDKKNPRAWYWAVMDYGTQLKQTHGNISRRSSIYKKQSPFKGSDREIRGEILRTISAVSRASFTDICADTEEEDRYRAILDELCEEGIVREKKGVYTLGE
jgi:A/G-specific adenine glycosylase